MIRPSRTLTPEQIKEKMCGNKEKHQSRKNAKQVKKERERVYRTKMNVYKCDFCGFYHIGHKE